MSFVKIVSVKGANEFLPVLSNSYWPIREIRAEHLYITTLNKPDLRKNWRSRSAFKKV